MTTSSNVARTRHISFDPAADAALECVAAHLAGLGISASAADAVRFALLQLSKSLESGGTSLQVTSSR